MRITLAEQDWPTPFWAGKLDEYLTPPVLEWYDQGSQQTLQFQSTFVQPEHAKNLNGGWWPGGSKYGPMELPLVFFFGGMDCPPGIEGFGIRNFAKAVQVPCVIVAPFRTKGSWWVLDRGDELGYIDGQLQIDKIEAFIKLMQLLCRAATREGSVDGRHPRALGFSAGAYTLTEILAHSNREPFIWSVALGGLHGHGQPEVDDIEDSERKQKARS